MGIDLYLLVPTNDYMTLLEKILGEKLLASFMFLFPDICKSCYGQKCKYLIPIVTESEFLHQEMPAFLILHVVGFVDVM